MARLLLLGIALAVLTLCASTALAQDRLPQARVREVLSAPAALRYTPVDTLTRFETQPVADGRLDRRAGVYRARYRIQAPAGDNPEAAARQYLASEASAFGWAEDLADLELVDQVETPHAHHLTFRQIYRDLPVYQRTVRVNLDARGAPTLVLSAFAPGLDRMPGADMQARRSPEAVVDLARTMLRGDLARHLEPEQVIVPTPAPRLAWRLVAWSERNYGEWELLIDDSTGEPIQVRDLSTHAHSGEHAPLPAQPRAPGAPVTRVAAVDGQGFVFDPDPLTTSGTAYAQSFEDADDQDLSEINVQRVLVTLPEIAQGNDGLYRLDGPFVRIVPESPAGNLVYDPPAETAPDGFRYGRASDYFEAVNAYYHVDQSQRHVQSLVLGRPIQNRAVAVNPHGLGNEDNARYYPTLNYIAFGAGGVDDAEDAFVIWHEYGHALLQDSAPGLLDSAEGRALHEGWADYWAASYARFRAETGGVPRQDWQKFFKWDSGDGAIWAGRQLAFQGAYPLATACDDRPLTCDIYADGMLWAVTQMSVYDALGRTVTDRLNLASHAYLIHPVTFRDAAEAVIQADLDLYAGQHTALLFDLFETRGLIDRSAFAPLVTHTPISWSEQLGGTLAISVEAVGISSEMDFVTLSYGFDGTLSTGLNLTPAGENRYIGQITLPDEPGTVVYALEAFDKRGLSTRLPSEAPETRFNVTLGPDTEPPAVAHEALEVMGLADWPPVVSATVSDNLGIDTVTVAFRIVDPQGQVTADSAFGLVLNETRYEGVFPVSPGLVEPGSVVSYRIHVQDQAAAKNETVFPETGWLTFSIIAEGGILRFYDAEAAVEGLEADGAWVREKPAYGTLFAHSGERAWGLTHAGPYPDTESLSSLSLPVLRIPEVGDAYLTFWHYYDTEYQVSGSTTQLWDGGNVKVSEDGGLSWRVLVPVGGYDGTIQAGRNNPLGGEAAYGGYSYGWQRALFSLPTAEELLIRFDFGTDAGNTGQAVDLAGWYVDDIAILAEAPMDDTLPEAILLPPARLAQAPNQALPDLRVEAGDNVGIRRVDVFYSYYGQDGVDDGSFRLAMSASDARAFVGAFDVSDAIVPAVGDSLTYRIRLADFDGNMILVPAAEEPALVIEYRLQATVDLVPGAVASGGWIRDGATWRIEPGDEATYSGLVMGPSDLPEEVDQLTLFMVYRLETERQDGLAGMNVKRSYDGGASWEVISPVDGYEGRLSGGRMAGEEAFLGRQSGLQQATFDLIDVQGRQIYLRIDVAGAPASDETPWSVQTASLLYSTLVAVDGGFSIPRELALHANFPNPFAATTTLGYTLPEEGPVRLALYDALGRHVRVLVDAFQPAGSYTVLLDGTSLASGVYLLRLTTPSGARVRRLVRLGTDAP